MEMNIAHLYSSKCRLVVALATVCAVPFLGMAATWYVDAEKYDASGSGASADTAFGTIQEAIDAASADDTIYVLPGTYDQGSVRYSDTDSLARVLVTKPLRIISTGGAAVTHIVGAPDSDTVDHPVHQGRGANAVRCVRFTAAAATSEKSSLLQGFTIRNGYCGQQYGVITNGATLSRGSAGNDIEEGNPGCVAMPLERRQRIYVTDSVIYGGYGVRGGNARYGCYVRCRFRVGNGDNAMGRDLYCVGCLFENPTANMMSCQLLNCTIVDAPSGFPLMRVGGNAGLYNIIFAHCNPTPPSGGIQLAEPESKNSSLLYPVNTNEADCVYGDTRPFFAPLRGDFHVRSETVEATLASKEVFETIRDKYFSHASKVGIDIQKDFDGNAFAVAASYPAGCYAQTKTPAGGCITFVNRRVVCEGYEVSGDGSKAMYAYSETPHENLKVTPPNGVAYFGYMPGTNQGGFQYPEMDESHYVAFPPAGVTLTNEPYIVEATLYVDPDGNEETADGSAAAPYPTLVQAVAAAPAGKRVLIQAADGDYKTGTKTELSCLWRVSLCGKQIRLKGAGRGASFISGAPDPDTNAGVLDRRGPNAVRCVLMDGSAYNCVQGFTIRDGYANSGTTDDYTRKGALVCMTTGTSPKAQCVDCELEGGQAFRGAQAWYGVYTRCIFHGWRLTTGGHAIRFGDLRSCLFYDNLIDASGSIDSSSLYQCTVVTTNAMPTHINTCSLDGCITYAAMSANAGQKAGGVSRCFYTLLGNGRYVVGSEVLGDSLARKVELGFVDVTGDFRLRTTSSILGNLYDGVSADYWKLPATDVYGVPLDFTRGQVLPGAVQTPAQVVVGSGAAYGAYSSGGGTNILSVGDSVTVSFAGDGSRRLDGLLVNGEEQGTLTYTYTCDALYDETGAVVSPVVISPVVATNWYVNAVSGSDDNNGYTPATAWKTLEKINTSGVVWEGDVVHAAPGDYGEGCHESATQGDSRFYLPKKITLVADEGPEVTRILGATGSGANGRGTGAMRCAELATGSLLKNFTLTGGCSTGTETAEANPNCGGGVLGNASVSGDTNPGTTYGCIITNCVAGRGGAARYGRLVNCRLLYNHGVACTSAGYQTELIGCYVDGCQQFQWCRYGKGAYRCTFGAHNVVYGDPFDNTGEVVDSVIMCGEKVGTTSGATFSGCIFVTNAAWTAELIATKTTNCRWVDTAAELGLDAEGRPITKTSLVVDAGTGTIAASREARMGGVDVLGLPRISNGHIDVGAYEFDWRPEYAADLGLRRDAVVAADEQVVEGAEGTVNIPTGAVTLQLVGASATRVTYDVPVQVTGTGTLTATLNDEPLATITAADGAKTLSFAATADLNSLVLAYAPGTDDTGYAQLSAMARHMKGTMLYFR